MIDARQETLTGAAGDLFVRSWRSAAPPTAIVAICPGFNSHSGYYGWVGEQLAVAGLAVYALDLRGRGKSAGERFYVETFDNYVSDVHTLIGSIRAREGKAPIFVLGHSAGGVVACLYALDHSSGIAGLICEDFAFEVPAPDFALAVLKGISHVAPHAHALKLNNADFSRDAEVVRAMDADPLIAGESQPFATMAAIVRADDRLKRDMKKIEMPVLIIHGTADKAAKPSGSRNFHEQVGSRDKTLKLYNGRYHDPLNDIGKEEILANLKDWIISRSAPAA